MPRLVYIVTHPMTASILLRGQLEHFQRRGFEVTLITSPGVELEELRRTTSVEVVEIPMAREISLWADLAALRQLTRCLKELRPEVVNAGTPKAGLLGMLAARLAGVPVRIYTLRGLRLETARGWKRMLLTWTERLASHAAQRVVCVSESLRRSYLEHGLCPAPKTVVLGAGSSNGVEVERFQVTAERWRQAQGLREKLGIPPEAPVIGFVGRLTRDKGAMELCAAFEGLLPDHPDLHLLILGDFEAGDPVPEQCARKLREHPQVVLTGFVPDTSAYYPLMDVLAFPSHREGLPNAPLEAAVAGVPVAGASATGTVDAVVSGTTGLLVRPGDKCALTAALRSYLNDPELRRRHGEAGQERASRLFRREVVWEALETEVRRLVSDAGPGAPTRATHQEGEALEAASTSPPSSLAYPVSKRLLDVVGASLALLLASPVLLLAALAVRLRLGSPVIFRQQRPGWKGEPFTLYKLRTMREARDAQGHPLPDHQRLTPLGRFLRTSSLDELPELVNVLRGDMSLVGPRPLLMEYLGRYSEEQARRHEARPGLTGWAQIHGRNALSWDEKFRLDVWYVDHRSFWLDLKILGLTALRVVRRQGITAEGHATMPKFEGSKH